MTRPKSWSSELKMWPCSTLIEILFKKPSSRQIGSPTWKPSPNMAPPHLSCGTTPCNWTLIGSLATLLHASCLRFIKNAMCSFSFCINFWLINDTFTFLLYRWHSYCWECWYGFWMQWISTRNWFKFIKILNECHLHVQCRIEHVQCQITMFSYKKLDS